MLEAVGLGVHRVDREAERLGQVLLEQPVVPDHLDRDALTRGVRRGAVVRLVLDEAELGQLLQHRRRGRRSDAHPLGERRRRRAAAGLELVELLEVVLDGRGRGLRSRSRLV